MRLGAETTAGAASEVRAPGGATAGPKRARRSLGRIARYAALALVSVAVTMAALAWYLGVYVFVPTRVENCSVALSARTAILAPNCTGEMFHPDYGRLAFVTNDLGLRDREAGAPPGAATARMRFLVVGDSFTFGAGVGAERLYHALVEAAHPGVRLLNAGFSGLGIEEEAEVVEHFVDRTGVDLVLIGVEVNDLVSLDVDGRGSATATARMGPLAGVARYARDHLVPPALVLAVRAVISREWSRIYQTTLDALLAARFRKFAEVVGRIRESLARRDPPVPLVVLLIPQVEQLNGFLDGRDGLAPGAPFEHLTRQLKGAGIPVLDSLPHFHGRGDATRLFFPRDRHLTAEGHGVLAEFLGGQMPELVRLASARGDAGRGAATR